MPAAENDLVAIRKLREASRAATVTQSVSKLAALGVTAAAARALDVAAFGTLFALLSLCLLLGGLADAGYSGFVAREAALRPSSWRDLTKSALRLYQVTLPISVAILTAYCQISGTSTSSILIILASLLLVSVVLFQLLLGIAGSLHLFWKTSVATILAAIVTAISVGVPYLGGWSSLSSLVSATLTGNLVASIYLYRACDSLRIAKTTTSAIVPNRRQMLVSGGPYLLSSLANLIYNRGDVLITRGLAGPTAAGLYAPGSQVQNAMFGLPAILSAGVVPVMTAVIQRDGLKSGLSMAAATARRGVVILLPLTIVMGGLGTILLPRVLGESFADATTPLLILLISIPIAAMHVPYLQLLIAAGEPGKATRVYYIVLAVVLAVHVVLTPRYGAIGAAIASLSREPIALILAVRYCLALEKAADSA
jgi:O-antigen/teichoic acid export membrane protein